MTIPYLIHADYPHGIRLVAAMNNRTLITFCANSQEEKARFVADLRETVQEVNEMEDIRIGGQYKKKLVLKVFKIIGEEQWRKFNKLVLFQDLMFG